MAGSGDFAGGLNDDLAYQVCEKRLAGSGWASGHKWPPSAWLYHRT